MDIPKYEKESLVYVAKQIDLAKAKFDIQLIEEDLARGLLSEASTTILRGGLATIKLLVQYKEELEREN